MNSATKGTLMQPLKPPDYSSRQYIKPRKLLCSLWGKEDTWSHIKDACIPWVYQPYLRYFGDSAPLSPKCGLCDKDARLQEEAEAARRLRLAEASGLCLGFRLKNL